MSGIAQYSQLGTFGGTVTTTFAAPSPSDTHTPATGDLFSLQGGYNGTNWDQWRGNTEGILLASAARTASVTSSIQTNYNARGIMLYLRISAASGTGGVKPFLEGLDLATGGGTATIWGPTATVLANGIYTYLIYPGAIVGDATSGLSKMSGMAVPRKFQVQIYHADATSYTYSLGYSLIL